MIADGDPIPAVAGHFGVTKQAFYMRRARDPDFDIAVLKAESDAELKFWGLLKDNLDGDWQGYACVLKRRFGLVDPLESAKIQHLHANVADTMEKQKHLRQFMQGVRNAEQGDPDAVLSDDRYEDEIQTDEDPTGEATVVDS